MKDKNRYKVEGIGVIIDTHTNIKYDLEGIVKVLNDTEYYRQYHKEERKKFENVLYDTIDVIEGFIKLEKLKKEGWI